MRSGGVGVGYVKTYWHVAFTKPRQEAKAQAQLECLGFEVYAPRFPGSNANPSVVSVESMFPRYFFLRLTCQAHSLAIVRSTCGVLNLLRFGLDPVRVSAEMIQKIRLLESGQLAQQGAALAGAQVGNSARVDAGPLVELLEPVAEKRVIALMSLLGRESAVAEAAEHLFAA